MRNPEFSLKGKFGGSFALTHQTIGTVHLLLFVIVANGSSMSGSLSSSCLTCFKTGLDSPSFVFGEFGRFLISSFLGRLYLPLVKPQQGTIPSLKTWPGSFSSSVVSESVYSDSDSYF